MLQWNCHSLNNEKLNYALSHNPDIMLLQEIWKPAERVKQYLPSNAFMEVRDKSCGGGTLLWIDPQIARQSEIVPINQDFSIHRLLIGRDKIMWLGSVYLSLGTPSQIKALFQRIYQLVPSYEWKFVLIAGDFNIDLKMDSPKKTLLNTLAKQKRSFENTYGLSELDFLLHGAALELNLTSLNRAPSDHNLLVWDLKLSCPETQHPIRVPNRRFAEEATNYAWKIASNTKDFLRSIQYTREVNPRKIVKTLKRKSYRKPAIQLLLDSSDDCDAFETVRNYFAQFYKNLEDKRFSNLSRSFFQSLKKIFKYDQLDKRDGSIISSIVDENGVLVDSPDEVNKQLMTTIKELQVDPSKPHHKNLEFPQLRLRTQVEMKGILDNLWNGKAIAWYSVTDSIFHREWKERSAKIFADLWASLKLVRNIHFEARLIPLNKIHPKIPSRKDIRPIVVNSPLVKLIESGIMPELSTYLIKKLHPGQTGFVPGNGIFVNIHRVIDRIRRRTINGNRCFGVFIDFTSP